MIPLIVAGVVGAIGGVVAVNSCSDDEKNKWVEEHVSREVKREELPPCIREKLEEEEKNMLDKHPSHEVNTETLPPFLKDKLRKAK